MKEDSCPHCGSTKRRIMYNKWHIKEIHCGECFRCLNSKEVSEQVKLAQMASREGKLTEFWFGTYSPSQSNDTDESAE